MTYTIRQGDTLETIAHHNGTTLQELMRLNPEFNTARYSFGSKIFAGGVVKLPGDVSQTKNVQSTPPKTPSPTGQPTDLLSELTGVPGQERDAYAALKTLFNSYGLGSLAPTILKYLQNGFGSDTITVLLQQTPEYKARFAGNQARLKNGLQVLTPAEYLSTEASYQQLLRSNGIDPSFATQTQYAEWIGNDVAPTELQSRIGMAVQATAQAPPSVSQYFDQLGIPVGDRVSYFLNDKTPTPALQLKLNQAQIGGAGLANNLQVAQADALRYAQMGVTYQGAQSAYQRIADILPTALQLTSIYKSQAPVNQQTLQEEFLGGSGQAQLARERLGQQETAAFSGTSGVGKQSFQQQTSGAPTF